MIDARRVMECAARVLEIVLGLKATIDVGATIQVPDGRLRRKPNDRDHAKRSFVAHRMPRLDSVPRLGARIENTNHPSFASRGGGDAVGLSPAGGGEEKTKDKPPRWVCVCIWVEVRGEDHDARRARGHAPCAMHESERRRRPGRVAK